MGRYSEGPHGEGIGRQIVTLRGGQADGWRVPVDPTAVGIEFGDPTAAVYRIVRDGDELIGVLA